MIGCKKREPGAPSFFVGGGRKGKSEEEMPMWRPPPAPSRAYTSWEEGTALAREGENYSIYLISKGAMVASGDRSSPTEAAAETESPFGTPRKSREKVRRNREEVKLPQSRLCRDSPLMEGACLPLWGRWPGGAGPEGVRAGRSRREIFLSRSVTGPKRFLAS